MGLKHDNMGVDEIEQSRYIILNLLREASVLLDAEGAESGIETKRYLRLSNKVSNIEYIESLIVKDLKEKLV